MTRTGARRVLLPLISALALGLLQAASLLAAGYTASVANLTFAALTTQHTSQLSNGTLSLSASDTSGSGAGWNVTLQSSSLAYAGPNGTSPANDIPAAALVLGTPSAPIFVSGQAIDATGGPKAIGSGGALSAAVKVMAANAGFGAGSYSQQIPLTLTVPADPRAGTYSATLTVTMVAGP